MRAAELLRDLEGRGVRFGRSEGHVHVEAPEGVLSSSDRRAIYDQAKELERLLRLREAGPTAAQAARIRAYGASLGEGGPEWAERLLEPGVLTSEEAETLLDWLDRRAAQARRERVGAR